MTIAQMPAGYQAWSADDKAEWLEKTLIVASEYNPVERPELSVANPLAMYQVAGRPASLARSLDRSNDLMEDGRPKIIHVQGSVAMVDFNTFENSDWTGVLASPGAGGGARGLVRMSLAIPPERNKAVTPGMGLKLLIDATPSLDLLAMNHTVGQGRDFNLFSNTFTHDMSEEHKELRLPQKVLQYFFKKVTSQPRQLTIDHFASVDRHGNIVDEPKVPNRLLFRPHDDVAKLFRGKHGEDYRETLGRIEPGSILYHVEVVHPIAPDGARMPNTVIGEIKTATRFAASAGGDRLFFRHMVAPEDRVDG